MTSTTQITLTISLVFILLFSFAIIGFSIGFANDNGASIDLSDDPELNSFYTDTETDLNDFVGDSENTYSSMINTTVEPGSDVIQSSASFAITPANIISATKNVIYLPYKKIFGSGSGFAIFFFTFIGFLVFIFGLLVYKAWKGQP